MTHPTQSELLNTVLQLFTREGLEASILSEGGDWFRKVTG